MIHSQKSKNVESTSEYIHDIKYYLPKGDMFYERLTSRKNFSIGKPNGFPYWKLGAPSTKKSNFSPSLTIIP